MFYVDLHGEGVFPMAFGGFEVRDVAGKSVCRLRPEYFLI